MGRKPKHPEHKEQAEKLMNELLDSLVALWTNEEDPQLNTVSEELEMSAAKVRNIDLGHKKHLLSELMLLCIYKQRHCMFRAICQLTYVTKIV